MCGKQIIIRSQINTERFTKLNERGIKNVIYTQTAFREQGRFALFVLQLWQTSTHEPAIRNRNWYAGEAECKMMNTSTPLLPPPLIAPAFPFSDSWCRQSSGAWRSRRTLSVRVLSRGPGCSGRCHSLHHPHPRSPWRTRRTVWASRRRSNLRTHSFTN